MIVAGRTTNCRAFNQPKQISMDRCSEDDFRVCDLAIAPRTLTVVAFPPDVTYLRVEQCVLSAADPEGDDVGSEDEEVEGAEEVWECLTDPLPAEYYGAKVNHGLVATAGDGSSSDGSSSSASASTLSSSSWSHWPSSVDVNYSVAAFCEKVSSTLHSNIPVHKSSPWCRTALYMTLSVVLSIGSIICRWFVFDADQGFSWPSCLRPLSSRIRGKKLRRAGDRVCFSGGISAGGQPPRSLQTTYIHSLVFSIGFVC